VEHDLVAEAGFVFPTNRRLLTIDAGLVLPGKQYTLEVTVVTAAGFVKSSGSFVVQPSPLLANLLTQGTAFIGASLVLDASQSVDPDNSAGALTYEWTVTCVDAQQQAASTCIVGSAASLFGAQSADPQLQLVGGSLVADHTYTVTVTVTHVGARFTREANAQINFDTVDYAVPVVSINGASLYRATEKLTLRGSAQSSSGSADGQMVLAWTEVSGRLDLATVAGVDLTALNLVVPPNVLAAGLVYQFRLTVTDSLGLVGRAQIEVTMATPPSGGSCAMVIDGADPATGDFVAFETQFGVKCSDWRSDHTPLQYEFSAAAADNTAAELQVMKGLSSAGKINCMLSNNLNVHHNYPILVVCVCVCVAATTEKGDSPEVAPSIFSVGSWRFYVTVYDAIQASTTFEVTAVSGPLTMRPVDIADHELCFVRDQRDSKLAELAQSQDQDATFAVMTALTDMMASVCDTTDETIQCANDDSAVVVADLLTDLADSMLNTTAQIWDEGQFTLTGSVRVVELLNDLINGTCSQGLSEFALATYTRIIEDILEVGGAIIAL
jgi:hypothetical protein